MQQSDFGPIRRALPCRKNIRPGDFQNTTAFSRKPTSCTAAPSRRWALSDGAFWILYTLRESRETLTQSDVCYTLYQPKQTVNSALKKLADGGYIVLSERKDRRSKPLSLTEKGRELAEKTVDRVIAAEHRALAGLTEEQQDAFIRLFRQYTDLLRDSLAALGGP